MARLRLLGLLGALVVALGGAGSLVAFGLRFGEFRVLSTGALSALVVALAVGVVALGWTGARTRKTRYW